MAQIDFDGVWKQFAKQASPAVQDLSLAVADAELLVVLGPSGCGKTTALRMLAGLEDPDAGDIRIDGRSVVNLEPKDRDIALVFQQYALYPHLTARNNMLYPLKVQHVGQSERLARVDRVAQLLGIGRLLDRKPGQLSGGEQQRVALGRAIVRQPRAFLMDEPLSNLDAQLRIQMRTEIKGLQRDLGITTFFVTHDQAEAMTLADRIAVMSAGRLQQIGTPDEVYDRPANLFVAEFLGSPPMNILPAERTADGLVVAGAWRMPVPTGYDLSHGEVRIGLRPEAIELVPATDDGTPVQVFLSEPLGSEVIVNARIGESMVKIRTAPDVRPKPGETVHLRARPEGLRFYDAGTGEALGA
ncbi:MAG TPA: ABC transporter ATP-binding protein [Thermomicrobiales bacterium]|jgi:ABC-type sugar transport system ATPase subunit